MNENYVIFSGSSEQDKKAAKILWQNIEPITPIPSQLVVPGVKQKLNTAAPPGTVDIVKNRIGPKDSYFAEKVKDHNKTAALRKDNEDITKLNEFEQKKKEAQSLLLKRREERMKKEPAPTLRLLSEPEEEMDFPNVDEMEDSLLERKIAIAEIDAFESNLKNRLR